MILILYTFLYESKIIYSLQYLFIIFPKQFHTFLDKKQFHMNVLLVYHHQLEARQQSEREFSINTYLQE